MTKKKPDRDIRETGLFAHLEVRHLSGIERSIAAGEYVDGPELAAALRNHGSHPIPANVLDYLCRFLEGQVPIPRGRSARPAIERQMRNMLVTGLYRRYLEKLKDRKRRYGQPAGWTTLDGTPAEIAARIVADHLLGGAESWRQVQNIASSRK